MIDEFTPVYLALMARGVSYADARGMDISTVVAVLDIPDGAAAPAEDQQVLDADGNPAPGTAPLHLIRPPKWWRGDRAAYASSRQAMRDYASGGEGGDPPS